MGRRLKRAARWLSNLEPGLVALAAPLLWFPTFRPAWAAGALAALLLVWLLRWLGVGRPGARTALDGSLLLLTLMVPVAVWASAWPDPTLLKLTGLILGLAAFRATVNAGRGPRNLGWASALYLALGLGLVSVGLLGATWAEKIPALKPLLARIPHLVRGLPGAETGINANQLGGAVILFLPVALAAWGVRLPDRRWREWGARLVAGLLALFLGAVLILTQSRSAWIGLVVGVGVMAWLRWRWARWLILAGALVLALGLGYAGPQAVVQALLPSADLSSAGSAAGVISLAGRVELWSRALYAIQDFPFTGCGLGAFRRVVHILYPLFLTSPDADIAHAHNIFLQTALDLGLPGLVAYLALVGTALWLGWRVARRSDAQFRWLGLGIVGALVAFHIYGLTDAIALGAKPGVAFWMLLALATVLDSQV